MSLEKYMFQESDVSKLQELGLVVDYKVSEMYHRLYQLYSDLLLKYLDKILSLSEKEEQIRECPFHLKPTKKEEQDSYQSLSFLDFFYIRNNLKLERLSSSDLELLKSRVKEDNWELDSTTEEIIKNTCIKVITNNEFENGTNINYGPAASTNYFAPNNVIVLGLRMDPEYESDTKDNPDWLDTYLQRERILEVLKVLVIKEAEAKKIPLQVITYNENSVVDSKTDEVKK